MKTPKSLLVVLIDVLIYVLHHCREQKKSHFHASGENTYEKSR